MISQQLLESLQTLFEGDKERIGFVLKDGSIVEVENVCEEPTEGFDVKGEDIIKYAPIAAATWHTHPNEDSNLSANDYRTFLNWPELEHYIIGTDGVSKFVVEDGEVLIAS